jgi:hypothetical protein
MIDPIDVTMGDELRVTIKTVYQNDRSVPYSGDVPVEMIRTEGGDDDGEPTRMIYFGGEYLDDDGRSTRRAVFEPGELPVYERRNANGWMKFSVDGGLRLAFSEDVEDADAAAEPTCGAETDDGPCELTAGWGRDADSGPCKHHADD